MIIIGSTAAKHWFPDFRQPKDVDVVATPQEYHKWFVDMKPFIISARVGATEHKRLVKVEGHRGMPAGQFEFFLTSDPAWDFFRELYHENEHVPFEAALSGQWFYATPSLLATIKLSHLHQEYNFLKHVKDYHFLREMLGWGTEWRPLPGGPLSKFFRLNTKPPRKAVNLKMTNEEFFGKSQGVLKREFIHDDIHRAIAFYADSPLFEQCKVDKTKAALSEALFLRWDLEKRLCLAREEMFVISIERNLPTDKALALICTRLSSGWFQRFCINYFFEILDTSEAFRHKFQKAVEAGKVRRYEDQ